MKPVDVAVIGAGNRGGEAYARFALENPHDARVVAVAERDDARRERLCTVHGVRDGAAFAEWESLLERPKLADAVLICTGDREHYRPALRAIELGYHVLLEKPMAVDPGECLEIATAAEQAGVTLTIAHVLRYSPMFRTVKSLLDAGEVGNVVAIQHNENVGYWHFAHSYVRGNWRRAENSSPIILAKSCHDMDLLYWFAGARCSAVGSFGSLVHFRPENAPEGHTDRCLDGCPHLYTCPFSAVRIYGEVPGGHWPRSVVTADSSREALLDALRTGPYGKCVYECDNDVVDNQVVALTFENGVSATFALSAFTHDISRTIKIMGTAGEMRIHLEQNDIEIYRFSDRSLHRVVPHLPEGGHGGGDQGLMRGFVEAVRSGNGGAVFSARESAEAHLMAFAAERARVSGEIVRMETFVADVVGS